MPSLVREDDGLLEAMDGADREEKRRRRLLWLLILLLVLLAGIIALFIRYVARPAPLPEILPLPVEIKIAPHYLFSIYGIDKPVGVAVSPQGDRIYVTESGGERLVKVFDRDGDLLDSFAPPRTRPGERSPVYLSTDGAGRVWVTDRLQHAVVVYDQDGTYLDTILGPDLTLSEYLAERLSELKAGTTFAYNAFEPYVHYQETGGGAQILPAPDPLEWAPLGIFFDEKGRVLLTDVIADRHAVREIPADVVSSGSWQEFDPPDSVFGSYGQGNGQFLFPNATVIDSQGRVFVTDSNNGRVSVWDNGGRFLFNLGQGSGVDALSLPRGATIDSRDYLYVVDAVGQCVKVYDISSSPPTFLFAFGGWGLGDGEFDYPNDIAIDAGGRLYITDRENNRVQVWLY